MATSPHQGTILYDNSDFNTDEPVDTALVRDALVGSLLHKADEVAQVRACWVALANGLISSYDEFLVIQDVHGSLQVASADVPQWYGFPVRVRFAPKIKADGTGYRLRCRLRGASSGGHRVDFAIAVAPKRAPEFWGEQWFGPVKYYTNKTNTSAAWLSADDGTNYLDISADVVAAGIETWSTFEDIGGDPCSVQVCTLEAIIVAQTFNAGSEPRLHGYLIAEYIGS
jgi:hypothetical protein